MGRRARIAAAVAGASIAALALMHVPGVRAVVLGSSCPFSRAPSAEDLERLRVASAASLRGAHKAVARPALGLALDASSRDDVRAWGARAGASCADDLGGAAIRCEGARVDDGPVARDVFFRFDPSGRLVAVDVMREGQPPAQAAALYERRAAEVAKEAGPATVTHGVASEEGLTGNFARVAAEYRFVDYAADVSATNLGPRGVVVREQYRSLLE